MGGTLGFEIVGILSSSLYVLPSVELPAVSATKSSAKSSADRLSLNTMSLMFLLLASTRSNKILHIEVCFGVKKTVSI